MPQNSLQNLDAKSNQKPILCSITGVKHLQAKPGLVTEHNVVVVDQRDVKIISEDEAIDPASIHVEVLPVDDKNDSLVLDSTEVKTNTTPMDSDTRAIPQKRP